MPIISTPVILIGLGIAALALTGKPKAKAKPGPTPGPGPGPDEGPSIHFEEDFSWVIDEPDWWTVAEERLETMLPKPGDAAWGTGEYDPTILAWEVLDEFVPDDIPYPEEPYAADGTFWQVDVPNATNYWAPVNDQGHPMPNPESVLGLIQHVAAAIEGGLPHWQESGEMILVSEGE